MKKGVTWILLTCLMVVSLVLASCSSSTTSSTLATTTTSNPTSTAIPTSSTTSASVTATTSSTVVSTSLPTTTSTGNWWDNMGIPQYGGIINTYQPSDTTAWTPYLGTGYAGGFAPYDECLFGHAYTTDPSVQDFSSNFSPPDYADGFMLTSYEMTDA